jgi:hypothetical protein
MIIRLLSFDIDMHGIKAAPDVVMKEYIELLVGTTFQGTLS